MGSIFRSTLQLLFGLSVSIVWTIPVFGQVPITLEKIWATNQLAPKSVGDFNFLKDGRHYTRLERNAIVRFDLVNGEPVETIYSAGDAFLIEDYSFSEDEQFILFQTKRMSIYRHSFAADHWVWDRQKKQLFPVSKHGKQQVARFSPTGRQVAFVRENNLFISDYNVGREIQITLDGIRNQIINGIPDWVYEEEFSFSQAYEWSPDGTRLAFMRFDETDVPEMTLSSYRDQLYPGAETYKYPKVGATNSVVTAHVYDLATEETIQLPISRPETEHYIPRIKWTADPGQLCVFRLNRHQNDLELILYDLDSGLSRTLLREASPHYISIHDNLDFLADGNHFIWTSEKDGFNHIYLYDLQGKEIRQLTKGDWEVTTCYGIDEKKQKVYFQGARRSPMQREIYEVPVDGGEIKMILGGYADNSAIFSSTFDYVVANHSEINSPPIHSVYHRTGKYVRTIEDNTHLVTAQREHGVQPVEFFSFSTIDEVQLNGWMIKPAGFDPTKKYPVFMFLYGGPGSQQVRDSWRGTNYWWFQMLAREGYLIACVDNRGTGGRGETFKKMTYLKLGHYETIDQIEAAKYLGKMPFVDASRIGIYGWSYGGYLSSLCLLKGNDVFKAGIAVAPITNWKWYDSIYTERYMRTEQENPEGYRENAPIYFADKLKGNYLLIHGTSDDNVHFQHTAEMANALIGSNKQFDTYFYPNRNHGIGNARLHLYTKMNAFIREHLGK